nr:hypothetical protein BaRGS_004252 [Batillaria attramentaria]
MNMFCDHSTLADDLKNHIMSLASASRDLPTAGKTSWLEAVEGGADSTCTDCGARFESARAYRAHRLTHHILMPERGAEDRGSNGGEDSPAFDDESGQGAGFSGLGLAADGSGFVCEECKAHFTSRDTYAMHMLLRAKNEACFPCRSGSLAVTNTTTDASSRNLLTSSSSSVNMTSAVPLLGKRSPKELKHEPRSEISRTDGLLMEATGRHKLADSPKSLGHELLTDVARAADYGATWWSKYMPWVTMGMATGGGGLVGGDTEGVGPPLPLVCYVCGEIFSSRDSLAMHVLFHTRDMPATVPDTQPSWHKPLTSNAMLAMGQAAMRQFQHGTSYNNHSLVTASFNHRQQQLSPTVVAVASAAAAAAAAVTPVTSSSFSSVQSSLQRPEASSQVDKAGANVSKDVNGRSQHNATGPHTDFDDGLKKTKWNHDSESSDTMFADRTLFQLHMGLHNVNNPWQCNACGLVCSSRLHFATHALHY